jgi:hypothetical protein
MAMTHLSPEEVSAKSFALAEEDLVAEARRQRETVGKPQPERAKSKKNHRCGLTDTAKPFLQPAKTHFVNADRYSKKKRLAPRSNW